MTSRNHTKIIKYGPNLGQNSSMYSVQILFDSANLFYDAI